MPRNTTLVIRNGNSDTLHYSSEILASGELAAAVDSGIVKVGNGNAPWSGLPSIGVPSNPIAITGASGVLNMVSIAQADYNNIANPDPHTLYFIV